MADEKRPASDWIASGEVGNIKATGKIETASTITFTDGADGSFNGLFTRVDENGNIIGYRAVNRDLEWVESNTTNIEAGASEVELLRLTVDHDISVENGSWAFACKVNNGSNNRDDWITFVLRDGGGNAIASKQFQIDKGDLGYPVAMWGAFGQAWPSGTEFVITAYSGQDSQVMGTMTPTTLKIIEAQAAPITLEQLETFDFSTLPDSNPHIRGHLWVNRHGSLRVSRG